jgi:hypothetical protein
MGQDYSDLAIYDLAIYDLAIYDLAIYDLRFTVVLRSAGKIK